MTRAPRALLDSNVVVALVVEQHEHHASSSAFFLDQWKTRLAVAAHSYAEAYVTLTRRGPHALFQWPADKAGDALGSVAAATILIGLTPAQTFEAVRRYGADGGIGPRLYDRLIGQVAVSHGIDRIVTWNVGHMRTLFPDLFIVTPAGA